MRYWKSNYFEKLINNLNIRKYIAHKGWLEFCTESEIIGWVYLPGKELKVIRLIYQNRILAEAPICEERYDVQEELSIGVPTGFRLPISNLNEKTDINQLLFEVSDSEDTNYVRLRFLKKYML